MKLPFTSRKRHARDPEPPVGVVLAPGSSGSTVLLEALAEAIRRFPAALGGVRLPADSAAFRRSFPEVLVRFEVHRAASPERVEIAKVLVRALHERLFFAEDGKLVPMPEYLARPHAETTFRVIGGQGEPRWEAAIPWRHEWYENAAGIGLMVDKMRGESLMTNAAKRAYDWVLKGLERGPLDLSGEKFAVLGAGAEIAPTEMLLAAGADVLWIDRTRPPERLSAGDFAGRLFVLEGEVGIDLLADPARARGAIIDFSRHRDADDDDGENEGVHLGLYAYAPGKGRELRLAALMDAIARSLPPGVARSVSLLISPTTPGEVQPEDRQAAIERRTFAQVWKKTLERTGLLTPHAHEILGDTVVARCVVAIQGTSYQAAQYLAKMMAAEALLVEGIAGRPVAVSANIAGITATKSLLHPLFQAAFLGAPRFHVEIYEPATTRPLACLLMLHDVLSPTAPGGSDNRKQPAAVRAKALTAQAVHGGSRALPWVMEPLIRVAAVMGLGKKPALVAGLIPRKKPR